MGRLQVPDAVVLPADPEQVQLVLDACVRHDIGVVPFGGGTSVVGGVNAVRGEKAVIPPRSPMEALARSFVASKARRNAARSTASLSGRWAAPSRHD
jgi:FAD/FMN-containing dehydrogenase